MQTEKLTKQELSKLLPREKIVEKYFNEEYHYEVEKVEFNQFKETILYLKEIDGKKRTKLLISSNFNKEGDRKYKSSNGKTIVNYFKLCQD